MKLNTIDRKKFRVTNKWLEENKLEKENVVLAVYENSGWTELETELIGEGSTYVEFNSNVPHYSIFAVTVKNAKPSEKTEETSEEEKSVEAENNLDGEVLNEDNNVDFEEEKSSSSTTWLWTFIILLIAIGIGTWHYINHKQN